MTDLDTLVVQFQNKNQVAFKKLYDMYSKSIHGVVYNIVKDTDIADELMQDVFIKAWNKADTYSSKKGRFFTWILNIARNTAIDKTRSKAYKQSKQNLNSDYFVDIITSNDNLDTSTDAIGIKKFVTNLGKKCKEVIELLYFKGFTQKEASEELQMPIGTVKTRNRNCIQQLRDMVL
ncbi:sigma-70 family RNA polymerase sigma factor [Winogradskyella echinorum]|uniref:Sigma-70 family RNA polymerase sigma factor n=1 Tax=Winogradskyella echinorum TaxID=538189 RepID=A0ABR6Y4N2_9FLAO|nr:sigma-70 family RNA polymerase sigma factor [Winogradskyella echinorum]MBC3847190.1 sigma-70 family RNA polymerase sigma factor [Winogradskyella echinorum]MBC5751538.1 sigma-70 family RNA polymerase sigma factor [Winogradskyella echinorum]